MDVSTNINRSTELDKHWLRQKDVTWQHTELPNVRFWKLYLLGKQNQAANLNITLHLKSQIVADKFCNLADVAGAGGGAKEARACCAGAKFRELAPVLTTRGASLKVRGKVYRACIQSVLGYANEI